MDETERVKLCRRLRPEDFIDEWMGAVFARVKAGKWDAKKLMPKERRRFLEEIAKPGTWAQVLPTNLPWYVWLIRQAAIERGRILSAERRLTEAIEKTTDFRRYVRFETDRESVRP